MMPPTDLRQADDSTGEADPGFRKAGAVVAATLLAALAVASGLLNAAAMTS